MMFWNHSIIDEWSYQLKLGACYGETESLFLCLVINWSWRNRPFKWSWRNLPSPSTAPVQPWKWPTRPWATVHLDYAGPFLGRMFLIAIDAHSKWMEVDTMSSTTSLATIQYLRNMFACFGLPEEVITDKGRNFVSEEFKELLQKNGIKHTTSAPYHPSTNGLAECAVQTFKQGLTKLKEGTINEHISRFLFNYRITPQSTTGTSRNDLVWIY